MKTSKFQLFRSQDHNIYFRLKDRKDDLILVSQPYLTKVAALQGIAEVINSGHTRRLLCKRLTSDFQFYFVLKSKSGRILGTSELFEDKEKRESGIENLQRAIHLANVHDLA